MPENKQESKSSPKPPSYNKLIDEQTWAFIDRTESWYPPETINYSIDRQRQIYNAMCAEFHQGHPPRVTSTDGAIESTNHHVPVRRYNHEHRKDQAMIIYFHGGGFVTGGLDSHDDVCAELCAHTGLDVTAVDYRLAPEHLHPTAFEDSLACAEFESARLGVPLILCGDSAGGNLAAAVAHAARDNKQLAVSGQVLIYPVLGGDTSNGSYITHANAPMLTTRDMHFYNNIRTGIDGAENDSSLNPLTDHDFSNLPTTVVFSAECDPLSDDGMHYCSAIEKAGGQAYWTNEPGLVHGYLRARHTVDQARDSFTRIADALNSLGKC